MIMNGRGVGGWHFLKQIGFRKEYARKLKIWKLSPLKFSMPSYSLKVFTYSQKYVLSSVKAAVSENFWNTAGRCFSH